VSPDTRTFHLRSPDLLPFVIVAGLLLPLLPGPLSGQVEAGPDPSESFALRDGAPLVYIDCNRCDMAHTRQEITFVNHVRDPNLAQVHVLVTDQQTGAGGRQYTLAFEGRDRFTGMAHTLPYTSHQSNSQAEERDGLTEALKLGLAVFAAQSTVGERLRVTFDPGDAEEAATVYDPWNNWTFEVYGGGNLSLESSQRNGSARYGLYVDRVTEEWKLRFRPYFNHTSRVIRREDSPDIRSNQTRHGLDSFVIRSVGGHWGTGIFGEYITNSVDNLGHQFTVTPAVEYSLFPYSEASRRSITFTYRVGYEYVDYLEETIYEQTEETLLRHSLNASVQIRQPWGSISSGLSGSHYFHDSSQYRLTFNGNLQFRLGSGFSVNLGGNYQRINDQLALPRGDASLEDILLQRRQLATTYRSSMNVGLSYTFGSIFSNVVNPRL
jgi:hypothetical protein